MIIYIKQHAGPIMEYGSNTEDIMEIFRKSEALKREQQALSEQSTKQAEPPAIVSIMSEQPSVGLNGIRISEGGEITRTKYFDMLKVDPSKYGDIRFTDEEARKITMSMRFMSTGINAVLPMMCSGPLCPFASTCPYMEINKPPVGRPCLVESQLVQHWTEQFIEEFNVDIKNYTELHLVSELAEFNIYEKRVTQYLAEKHKDLMQNVITTIDHTGEAIENQEISRAWELKEKIKKGRMRVLEALMATRKERVKLKMDQGTGNSAAEKMSDLKKRLEEVGQIMKGIRPINSEHEDENKV